MAKALDLFGKVTKRAKETAKNKALGLFREPRKTVVPKPSAIVVGKKMIKNPKVLSKFKSAQDDLLRAKRKRR